MSQTAELEKKIAAMPAAERAKLKEEILGSVAGRRIIPSEGPQMAAYFSEAFLLFYGGAAAGGKTALIEMLALNEHRRSAIARRQYTDLNAIIEETIRFNGTRDGFNGNSPPRLRTPDHRLIEFIAAAKPGDEEGRRGQPIDLLGVDEAAQWLESQIRFLMGWIRTTDKNQRCRVVLASNPPMGAEGEWLIRWFAPWLDPYHPNPAKPGELRWFVSDEEGNDKEVPGPDKVMVGGRLVQPLSRTFIPAALKDNPFLRETDYQSRLDGMPEPLRSALRDGNFHLARKDDERQLIPTQWVKEAQQRWTPQPPLHAPMCAMGIDVAQGGLDHTVLAPRYDAWFGPMVSVPGKDTPLGSDVAALVVKYLRSGAVPIIDCDGGYGGAAREHLMGNGIEAVAYKGSTKSSKRTKDRLYPFVNKRAECWWAFREALDPDQEGGSPVALPPDEGLMFDLISPRFDVTVRGIQIESKDDIRKRLGRSPDKGDAVVMAWSAGPALVTHAAVWRTTTRNAKPSQFKVINSYENRRRRR